MCSWWSPDRRQAGIPEFRVSRKVSPPLLLSVLYQQCAGAFGKTTLPIEFQIGKEEFEFQNASQSLILPASTIYALRFCLSYLDRPADWSKEDYFLRFTAANEQLQIDGRSQKVFCPARGSWSGIATVSARELFRRLPKRFTDTVVALR
jgi:hypothetical protein